MPTTLTRLFARGWLVSGLVALGASTGHAQAPLLVYTDHLVNGFQDWSWGSRSLTNSTPVHSGNNSISATLATWEALSFYHGDLDVRQLSQFTFWAHGGTAGGQVFQVYAEFGTSKGPSYSVGPLTANTWKQYAVPLTALGLASVTNFHRITLQLKSTAAGQFYLDDIEFTAKPAPARVQLGVDAGKRVRLAEARHFGINTAVWDGNFDKSTTVNLLTEMGALTLRFPGGSMSDTFHWRSNYVVGSTWQGWPTWFTNFAHVATNIGAGAFITVNYGTGTPGEAADWVRLSNQTNRYGFKYWEIGNENYGGWEADATASPHDPYTYAVRAKDYIDQMKAADPSIKVGVVVAAGEDSFANAYSSNHPALNPRTGATRYGWTPVLLTTLKSLGVKPDFAVHHFYPQWTLGESDPLLLQASVNWARDAADLRQQIADYYGPAGTNIELVCTENNSNSGDQGKQSVSLVNALYLADSAAQILQTEFNAYVWWDLRNGIDNKGNLDPVLYGWRMYGDIGMINGLAERYPHFYAAKLLQFFARPGDAILSASSDYPLLAAYAARRTNGTLTLLAINKDPTTNLTAQITLDGFSPQPAATVRSYGIPQDEAARTNATAALRDIALGSLTNAGPSFTASFAPYSLTVLTLTPELPVLQVSRQTGGGLDLSFLTQAASRYVLEATTNLVNASWQTLTNLTGTGSMVAVPITEASEVPRLFRVRVEW